MNLTCLTTSEGALESLIFDFVKEIRSSKTPEEIDKTIEKLTTILRCEGPIAIDQVVKWITFFNQSLKHELII